MPFSRSADIVFVLDISASMRPCIEGIKTQIGAFVETFRRLDQITWDLRLGLLAHQAGVSDANSIVVRTQTLASQGGLQLLYGTDASGLFTRDVEAFRHVLAQLAVEGDEAMLLALDCAMDFPWRADVGCHRVVVMMTDEPIEDGMMLAESRAMIGDIIKKLIDLRISLYVLGPDSPLLDALSAAPHSEWVVVDGHTGLRDIDFHKVLKAIAQSISTSAASQQAPARPRRALFGQDQWGPCNKYTFSGR